LSGQYFIISTIELRRRLKMLHDVTMIPKPILINNFLEPKQPKYGI